ncbi:MAG TPA: hypothetical protein VGM86_09735 [Thermoanaerobaculia bacterium]|jgi:hypothetical protein
MDDSERSYGYSEDIYHGQHDREDEKSYEYGAEDPEETQAEELSPEEQAIHIEGSHKGEETVASGDTGSYDYGREGSGDSESFTWDIPGTDVERERAAAKAKVRVDEREGRLAEERLEPAKRQP